MERPKSSAIRFSNSIALVSDQTIAFHAIWTILRDTKQVESDIAILTEIASQNSLLAERLVDYTAPQPVSSYDIQNQKGREENRRKREEQGATEKAAWLKFREDLIDNPSLLSDPANLAKWSPGMNRLPSIL